MQKGKKVAVAAGVSAGLALLFYYVTRAKAAPPAPPEPPPPLPNLANLYGVIVDSSTGTPLSDVSVGLWGPDEAELLLHTNTLADGSYTMENIYPGSYVVYFYKDGYEAERRSIILAEGNNELSIGLVSIVAPPAPPVPPLAIEVLNYYSTPERTYQDFYVFTGWVPTQARGHHSSPTTPLTQSYDKISIDQVKVEVIQPLTLSKAFLKKGYTDKQVSQPSTALFENEYYKYPLLKITWRVLSPGAVPEGGVGEGYPPGVTVGEGRMDFSNYFLPEPPGYFCPSSHFAKGGAGYMGPPPGGPPPGGHIGVGYTRWPNPEYGDLFRIGVPYGADAFCKGVREAYPIVCYSERRAYYRSIFLNIFYKANEVNNCGFYSGILDREVSLPIRNFDLYLSAGVGRGQDADGANFAWKIARVRINTIIDDQPWVYPRCEGWYPRPL